MNQTLLEKILAKGFPTQRDEAWKYTPLHRFAAKPFKLVDSSLGRHSRESGNPDTAKIISENYIIFINGYSVSSSFGNRDKNKIKINSLEKTHPENLSGDIFEDLNQYFFQNGFTIEMTQTLEKPLQILYFNTEENWVQPRNVIKLKKNTQAIIIETFHSTNASVMNVVTTLEVEKNATLSYIKIQQEHEKALHIGRTAIVVHENAVAKTYTFSKGSLTARSDIHVKLKGQGAETKLYGLYTPKSRTHLEHHTCIEHAAVNTKSDELYHGVLMDESHAVFNGKVRVEPHATQTQAEQANHNLLLSQDAEIDTKPELEIYCDDIKCTHGATIGQLDDNALFYLRSRGLDETSAKQLLIEAFSNKIFESILDKDLQSLIKEKFFS